MREFVGRALGDPKPPVLMERGPAQEQVHRTNIDLGKMLPALHHTAADAGRYVTAGIVIARDPETGVYNASYHRLMLAGPNKVAIQLDFGRHLRAGLRARPEEGPAPAGRGLHRLDLALHYTAATMGSQMPESADELAVAGGLCGRPLSVVKAVSQDLLVPAESEIVLEGVLKCDEEVMEGPFGEFVGYLAPADPGPVLEVTAVTHRNKPIYHAINGYGRETVVLRKYVLEASLLKVLQGAVPIVTDAEMTAGGLHRFHAIVQVKKTGPAHDGLQRNAIMASFGALKDLDMVIVVDDDIDIRDWADVEYALATRMEASKDLFTIPAARGHEYVRVSDRGMRTKLGIDATVPFADSAKFARCEFKLMELDAKAMSTDAGVARKRLGSLDLAWIPKRPASPLTKPLRLAATIPHMKMSETRELYNKRLAARLTRATPEIFPAPVLIHANNLRWMPPMPRLAADSYWRAHVIRADRLSRALAAQSGAPDGWTWRTGKRGPLRKLPPAARHIARRNSRAARASAACGQAVSIASAGTATCGTPARTAAPNGIRPASRRGDCGTRRATTTGCCASCSRAAARRAAAACGRPPRSTTACRCFRCGRSAATRRGRSLSYWGVPNLQVINRDVHAAKCAEEAKYRVQRRTQPLPVS